VPTHPLWRPFRVPDDEEIARFRLRPHVPAPVEVVAPAQHEPDAEQHRFFRGADPTSNVHVFPPGSREGERMRRFRDWLRTHADDRAAYAELKRELARQGFTDVMHYNNAKAGLIYDVYERIFTADPQAEHDPRPRGIRT
jgi:GrpB-like predicted nucleotidyltransferase (UPF0157 family)